MSPADDPMLAGEPMADAGGDWDEPRWLHRIDRAQFPIDALPRSYRAYALSIATALEVPVELPASCLLGVGSGALLKRVRVHLEVAYTVEAGVYIVVVAKSGSGKTPVFRLALRPFRKWEEAVRSSMAKEIEEAEKKKALLRMAEEAAKSRMMSELRRKSGDADEQAQARRDFERARDENAEFQVPTTPQMFADDETAESLTTLLGQHQGRMFLAAEEGTAFANMAGRYASNGNAKTASNPDVLLKAWDGGEIRRNRVGSGATIVKNARMAVLVCVQPKVLTDMLANRDFVERGLMARILKCWPEDLIGKRKREHRAIDLVARDAWERDITALLDIETGCEPDGEPRPYDLHLSAGARDAFRDWDRSIEARMAPGAPWCGMQSFGAKLAGQTGAIAAQLHLVEHAGALSAFNVEVSSATMQRAIRIAQYFADQERAILALSHATPETKCAGFIVEWLERMARKGEPVSVFSERESLKGAEGKFRSVDDEDLRGIEGVRKGLAELEKRDYVRGAEEDEQEGRRGRPPSPRYEVNPAVTKSLLELQE